MPSRPDRRLLPPRGLAGPPCPERLRRPGSALGPAARAAVLAAVLSTPASAWAQESESADAGDLDARIALLRAAALERGWQREDGTDGAGATERWCPPPGPCAEGATTPGPDVLVVSRTAVGATLTARLTAPSGWRVTASLGTWGDGPPTFALRFERGRDVLVVGWELHTPPLSDGTTMAAMPEDVGDDFHGWLAAELLAYLESPARFRERVLARSAELRAHTRRHAASLSVCDAPRDPGRFVCVPHREGHAMMDTCVHRALTDAEREAFVAETESMLEMRDAIARAHGAELHAALVHVLGGAP